MQVQRSSRAANEGVDHEVLVAIVIASIRRDRDDKAGQFVRSLNRRGTL